MTKSHNCREIGRHIYWGRGGGLVVSVLAFYSDDPSSNPKEDYIFSVKGSLKRTNKNKKESAVGPLKKENPKSERERGKEFKRRGIQFWA